jgi:hypothetical protein
LARYQTALELKIAFNVKKVCFVVMPYGRKPTQAEAGKGPAKIDFNALWDRCYVPVIQTLDYHPVRADQDGGALDQRNNGIS